MSYRMDPKPSTSTTTFRTRRHLFRNCKVRKPRPHTRLIHTKHSEILRSHLANIAFVRNRQCAPFHIVESSCVKFCYGATGTNVIALLNVSTWVRCEEGRSTFVACCFESGWLASGKLKDIFGVRREIQMTMEPPLRWRIRAKILVNVEECDKPRQRWSL